MQRFSKFFNALFAIFFWVFNVTVLLVLGIGGLFSGFRFLADAIAGQVPLDFVVALIGLVGAPATCSLAGIKPQRQISFIRSLSYFQLFYFVEAPLLTLCLLRFFWLRDLTPLSTFVLLTGLSGTIVAIYPLFRQKDASANNWQLAGQTIVLSLSLYLSLIAAFYVPPIVLAILLHLPLMVTYSLLLFPVVAVLFGLGSLPFGMVLVYGRAWWQSCKQLALRQSVWRVRAVVITVLAVEVGLIMLLQQQPQIEAFRLLQAPPTNDGDRQALLQHSDTIRRGLLNAYLSPYRYLGNDTEMRDVYGFLSDESAQKIQDLYNRVLMPFRYSGTSQDVDKAAALYAQFFDAPILRAEKAAIQAAIQSTFNRTEAKAGLDDINERRVWLEEQQITVKPAGDWAEIELYEVYNNKTPTQTEIFYTFSLPESAVITGIWLGETSDRSKRSVFEVAPRGAAQQVYTEQVKIRVDPALLEQIGPRSYRLRAFPIPPQGSSAKMHLWMTYNVLQQDAGWALPHLHERRNLFWTDQTKRLVNNQPVAALDQWLPIALPAKKVEPKPHQVTLASGSRVIATPYPKSADQLPKGKRFAVVLDRSHSMTVHRSEVAQTFNWLKQTVLKQNAADLYLTTAAPAQPQRPEDIHKFDPQAAVFYGTLQPREMLNQFLQLRGNTRYDAVLVITDSGSYELSKDERSTLDLAAPLWMVHLGGLQFAYDDATLQAIQNSGGGVSTNIQEVMQRLGTRPTLGGGTSLLNLVDGYAWFLGAEQASSSDEAFAPLAARQWITQLAESVKPNQLNQLDTIHAIAEKYKIVTPLSSMIVLVNQQQRQDLKQAEQQSDRFDRKVEDQQLPQPSKVSAVPEPSAWLLIAVGLVLLGLMYGIERSRQIIADSTSAKRVDLHKSGNAP